MRKIFFLCLATLLFSGKGTAWDQVGHDVVAIIAQRHLTNVAQAKVSKVFDGKSLVYWANWLDNASHTPEYAYTKTWHYKNIDADETYDSAQMNPNGDIVTALNEQISKLKSGKLTKDEEHLALRIVVHLMGDLHQPLHMGHRNDLGGNKWYIVNFGQKGNIHGAWDQTMVERGHKWSHTEWADELDRADAATENEIVKGNVEDWARQTYAITTKVYDSTPEQSEISYNYVATWTPTVELQLLRGGLRLANILNDIFR